MHRAVLKLSAIALIVAMAAACVSSTVTRVHGWEAK